MEKVTGQYRIKEIITVDGRGYTRTSYTVQYKKGGLFSFWRSLTQYYAWDECWVVPVMGELQEAHKLIDEHKAKMLKKRKVVSKRYIDEDGRSLHE